MKSALRSGRWKSSCPTLCAASTMASMPRSRAALATLRDREHEAGAVAEVGQHDHPDCRIGGERPFVRIDQRLSRGGLRKRDHHPHPPVLRQRVHAGLHAVVIEIGVEHGIAGLQPIILHDQRPHRLGGVAGEADLVDAHPHRRRESGAGRLQIADHRPARVIAGVAVHPRDVLAIGGEHRAGHHSPIAVLELNDLAGHVYSSAMRSHLFRVTSTAAAAGVAASGNTAAPPSRVRRSISIGKGYQTARCCRASGPAIAKIIWPAPFAPRLVRRSEFRSSRPADRGNPSAARPASRTAGRGAASPSATS